MDLSAIVLFLVTAAVQDKKVEEIAPKAKAGSNEHDFSVYILGVLEAVNCFNQ